MPNLQKTLNHKLNHVKTEEKHPFVQFEQIYLNVKSECPASNGQIGLNDVHIVNLGMVSDVQVKKEVTTTPEPPQSLNLQRVSL